jgi:hypothetical protein
MATINNSHILKEKDLVVNNEYDVNLTVMKKSNWLVLTTCKILFTKLQVA